MNILLDVLLLILCVVSLFIAIKLTRVDDIKDVPIKFKDLQEKVDNVSVWQRLYPKKTIRRAGLLPQNIQFHYWVGKASFALFIPLCVFTIVGEMAVGYYLLLLIVGWFLIDLWFLYRKRNRANVIQNSLGYFVDLLWAFMKSGMNLERSLTQAGKYGFKASNPLAHEVVLISREINAGMDREMAFQKLADRTGVTDLKNLAGIITVGLRVGSPLADILERQSQVLRAKQAQRFSQMAQKKSLQMLIPMMLIGLPLFLVVVFFPSAVQILEAYSIFTMSGQ